MANPLQEAAEKALPKLPYAFASMKLPRILPAPAGSDPKMRAGIEDGNGNSPIYAADQVHWNDPDYTPQLLGHELYHDKVNNLPGPLRRMMPPDNPSDPYNENGRAANLKKVGGDPLRLPNEEGAADIQDMIAGRQNGKKLDPIYDTFEQKVQALPQSVMQPTDPNQKGINTMPRDPGMPSQPVWGMKKLYATKVIPVKSGSGTPEVDWSTAQPISSGPQVDWSTAQPIAAVNDGGVNNRPGVPAAPLPEGLQGTVTPPSTTEKALTAVGNMGLGALKGGLHTISGSDDWARQHLPAFLTNSDMGFGAPANLAHVKQMATPQGTAQKIGYGGEQAGEFLLPGAGEEEALTRLAPYTGKSAPVLKAGLAALGSGAVNKAQGGKFWTGAIAGGVGSGVAQGLASVAPNIAESALNIRKLDRAYKEPGSIGKAILNETSGITPSSVAESAQGRLNELNPQLNAAADRASVAPNSPRGLLPAPGQEIPLGRSPGLPEMPGALLDAQPFPVQNVGEARVIRNPKGQILPRADRNVEFPDDSGKLPFGRNPKGQILSRVPTRQAWMTGAEDEVPNASGISGPGVLLRPFRGPIGAGPIPSTIPNASASLTPARNAIANAFDTAGRQGERTTLSQLQPLAAHLGQTIDGEPIPSNVTPRQLLDLKRGFGSEFVHRWNPDTMQGVKGTAAQAYSQMAQEFNRVVPEGKELNGRISSLIPVAKRAESLELNAPTTQQLFHRLAVPTGAMAAPLGMGAYGYEKGGIGGAAKGFAEGMAIPLLAASPTGQMALARGLNSAALRRLVVPGTIGAGLQLTRSQKNHPDQ